MSERKAGQPHSMEEILSFDRIKRAMSGRVTDRVEDLWHGKEPISAEQISNIISDEWQKVKDAVLSSPAARAAFRKYLERTVSEQIDKLIKRDRGELESLGVVEKGV